MNKYIYIGVMALVTFLIRILPLTLIRRKIENRTLRSFLYYVPYVTLAVMTFPAVLDATQSPISALAAFIIGILLAWLLPVQNWSPGLKSDILHGNTGLCPFGQGRNLPLHRISVAVAQVLFYHIPASISIASFSFFCRFMQRTFPVFSLRFWCICTNGI